MENGGKLGLSFLSEIRGRREELELGPPRRGPQGFVRTYPVADVHRTRRKPFENHANTSVWTCCVVLVYAYEYELTIMLAWNYMLF